MPAKNSKADVIGLLGLLWDKARLPDYTDPNAMQTEAEMLMNVCWFNCMGVDDALGKFDRQGGRLNLTFNKRSRTIRRSKRRRPFCARWPPR